MATGHLLLPGSQARLSSHFRYSPFCPKTYSVCCGFSLPGNSPPANQGRRGGTFACHLPDGDDGGNAIARSKPFTCFISTFSFLPAASGAAPDGPSMARGVSSPTLWVLLALLGHLVKGGGGLSLQTSSCSSLATSPKCPSLPLLTSMVGASVVLGCWGRGAIWSLEIHKHFEAETFLHVDSLELLR
ncbi:Hypothetical predicted protein [Podarcis lilfordi]|uniref:Uncharacterized protein n=1 Tax=Podarcis lilfordi TaxID=74358 RepID=A0AA35KWJ2_9SAUR|nr:Hypothetical predicted protein [Podarcis lilfordi]